MESVKRAWVSPVTGVQEFVAQEFIAACNRIIGSSRNRPVYLDLVDPIGRYNKDFEKCINGRLYGSGYDSVYTSVQSYNGHENGGRRRYEDPDKLYSTVVVKYENGGYYAYNAS